MNRELFKRWAALLGIVALFACAGVDDGGHGKGADGDLTARNNVGAKALDVDPGSGTVPVGALPVKDGGHSTFFYGRVKVHSIAQYHALQYFGFGLSPNALFDEYDAAHFGTPKHPGWQYAIATGTQWNIVLKYHVFADAVEINPHTAGVAHPMLSAFTSGQLAGGLNPQLLADAGFHLQPLGFAPKHCGKEPSAPPSSLRVSPRWFGSDLVNWILDASGKAATAIGNLLNEAVSGSITALDQLFSEAWAGVQEAIDDLRKLGNDGVCLIAGQGSHGGRIFVADPVDGGNMAQRWVMGTPEEPIRNASVHAHGGPGGILLATADIGSDGTFEVTNLCHIGDYDLNVVLSSGVADVTTGLDMTPRLVRLGARSGDNQTEDFVLDPTDPSKDDALHPYWFIGAQLGYEFAVSNYGIQPKQALINAALADDLVMAVVGGRAITPCGEVALLGVPGSSADIFAPIDASNFQLTAWPGRPLHEYGHFLVCEAIRQYAGPSALNAYLTNFLSHVLTGVLHSDGYNTFQPVRNSAESLADLFAYRASGYTDYFANNNGANFCPGPPYTCLDPDMTFSIPVPDFCKVDNEDAAECPDGGQFSNEETCRFPICIGSRASIMYDWLSGPPAPPNVTGIHLGVQGRTFLSGIADSGTQVTTENIAAAMAAGGVDAEKLCKTFGDHEWLCDPLTLDAPTNFAGVAKNGTTIHWSWTNTSKLADQVVVQNLVNGQFSDVATLGASAVTFDQVVGPEVATPVVARVQARRADNKAKPGSSMPADACTLSATFPAPSVKIDPVTNAGVIVTWTSGQAASLILHRETTAGAVHEIPVAAVSTLFDDNSVAPGQTYTYRVDSLNCNQLRVIGVPSKPITVPTTGSAYIYVVPGAVGGNGTKASPFGTITDALTVVTSDRNRILVAGGTLSEYVRGIGTETFIFGSYDVAFTKQGVMTQTVVAGGVAENLVQFGGGEMGGHVLRPIISSNSTVPMHIDFVKFDPSSRTCGSGCLQLTLARVPDAGVLELTNSVFVGATGGGTDALVGPQAQIYAPAASVTLEATKLDNSGGPAYETIRAQTLTATGCRLVGTAGVFTVRAETATIDKTLVRGDVNNWMPPGSMGVTGTTTTITNSIVAAEIATSIERADIVWSLTYGAAQLDHGRVIDTILIADGATIPLQFHTSNIFCVGGNMCEAQFNNVVAGNLFVATGGQPLASTDIDTAMGSPGLTAANINIPNAWFNFSFDTSGITGNLSATATGPLFGAMGNPQTDPTDPINKPLQFHPAVGAMQLSVGVAPSLFSVFVADDMDGNARPQTPADIGPYVGTDHKGKP